MYLFCIALQSFCSGGVHGCFDPQFGALPVQLSGVVGTMIAYPEGCQNLYIPCFITPPSTSQITQVPISASSGLMRNHQDRLPHIPVYAFDTKHAEKA
jgi:hypothetical protein